MEHEQFSTSAETFQQHHFAGLHSISQTLRAFLYLANP